MTIKNVLVTGCCGFVGAATCRGLVNAGHNVAGIDDNINAGINQFRAGTNGLSSNIKLDIPRLFRYGLDEKYLFEGGKFDAIIHLAAIPGVRDSIRDPKLYYRNNLIGTLNILELMLEYEIPKLVFASTSSVYDWSNAPYKPIGERTQFVKPRHPYAGSKLAAEDLCRMYHELHGLDVSVLRYFTVYGPSGRPDMFPLRAVRWACEGEPIQLNGDGSQERDFTYIDDVVDANIRAVNHEAGFEVFNIGAGVPFSLVELIGCIEEKKEYPQVNYGPGNNLDANFTWADNSKARDLLGWEPETTLYEGIRKTVEWYRENRAALKDIKF